MVITNLAFVPPEPARAANHTGFAEETATIVNGATGFDFVGLEVDEQQTVAVNATGGTFTLSFDGSAATDPITHDAGLTDVTEVQTLSNTATAGSFTTTLGSQTTGPISFNASAATVEAALDPIADVTVTGSNPWTIQWVAIGDQESLTTDDSGLSGSVVATTTQGNDGGTFTITFDGQTTTPIAYDAGAATVESALQTLSNINDVAVTGTGISGDPWVIEFIDPGLQNVAEITTDDGSLNGTSFVTTTQEGVAATTNEIQELYNDATTVDEVQTIHNGAVGGTYTITFDGQTTAPIAYNAGAATVKGALEALVNVNNVAVTGTGNPATPWQVTFLDPGAQDVAQMTTDDTGLDFSTVVVDTEGNLSLETALEALTTIGAVAVSGTPGSWTVTFEDPGAMDVPALQLVDNSLTGGASSVTITDDVVAALSAPIDPSGIVNIGGNLLVSDSEIDEEPTVWDGVNLWEMTAANPPVVLSTGTTWDPGADEYTREPTGLAYNPATGNIFVSSDDQDLIFEVDPGVDGIFDSGDDITTFDTLSIGVGDPEDVTWDPVTGSIFIAGGNEGTIAQVNLGGDGMIGGGDDVPGVEIDLSAFADDIEGIAYRAASDTLLLSDRAGPQKIFEVTKDGRLIRTIDIGFATIPADLEIAPASAGGGDSVYLVDRVLDNGPPADNNPPRDGKLYELSIPFANLAPFVNAGLDQVTELSDPLTLIGDAYDDGQPTPNPLTVTWSHVPGTGPDGGVVNFGTPNSLTTTVSFNKVGGAEKPYELKLSVSDGSLTTEDTVLVSVFAHPPPAPQDDAATTDEDVAVNIDVLANDTDPDNNIDPSTLEVIEGGPASGTAKVKTSDWTITYTPAQDYAGPPVVFAYRICDLTMACGTGEVTVTVNPIADPPKAGNDSASTNEDTPVQIDVLANDIDPENDIVAGALKVISNPSDGSAKVLGNDNVEYTPDLDFNGSDDFTYQICDATALCDIATVTVTVNPVADDTNTFIDDDNSIFEADIEWAAAEGITKGCNPPVNDRFCPDDFVTRGQMAAFLVRAFGYTAGLGADLFIDDDGTTFENDIDRLGTAGVTTGCNPPTNNLYCPDDFVTRGQMAAFLHRAFGG
jgi:hypothetical protein